MSHKIAFIVNQLRPAGPIFVVLEIIKWIDRSKFEPVVICLRSDPKEGSNVNDFRKLGVECQFLNYTFRDLELRTKEVAKHLAQVLDQHSARLAHAHTYHATNVVALLPARFKTLCTLHNISRHDFVYGKGYLLGMYMNYRFLKSTAKIDMNVAISDEVLRYYSESVGKEFKGTRIYNGIDMALFNPIDEAEKAKMRNELGIKEQDTCFIVLGRLSRIKNSTLIVKCFAHLQAEGKLQNCHLLIVGEGSDMRKAKRSAANSPNIHFLGFQDEPQRFLSISNIAVTASRSEGFGLSFIEALAMGLKVVHTDLPTFREIIAPYPALAELRFPVDDEEALKKLLQTAPQLQVDPAINEDIRKRFSAQLMSQQYGDLYLKLLK